MMGWKLLTSLLAPLLCLALLGGIVAEKRTHLTPEDADPYHARAKQAIGDLPYYISDWVGRDEFVAPQAVQLLRPNEILSRRYVNTQIDAGRGPARSASLLIVQCRDSRDMLGHYPPVCYPAHGETEVFRVERDWELNGVPIRGMEYLFTKSSGEGTFSKSVYNFMVVPGHDQTIRNMAGLRRTAKDYQLRYFGAAQFQVVMSGEIPQEERDEIFETLISATTGIVQELQSIGEPE